MEEMLLNTLLQAQQNGLQTDNSGFRKAEWSMALEAVQAVTNQLVTLQQVKSKFDAFKLDWKAWRHFVDQSGHGWDAEKGAEPDVLESYFEARPRARNFRNKLIPYAEQLQTLLHGALATEEEVTDIDVLILEEERREDDNSDDEEGQLVEQSEDEQGCNSDEWPDSPIISRSTTVLPIMPSPPASTTPSQPTSTTPGQPRRPDNSLRKRTLKSAAEADQRKRKKSSGHALADALDGAIDEIKASREVLTEMGQPSTARAAKILASEFGYLSGQDQDLICSALGRDSQADLFLARNAEDRKCWVNRTLRKAKGVRHETRRSSGALALTSVASLQPAGPILPLCN
jgi:Myb/SANT-like DNA-binding domain